jgi:hypothetical protein
MISRNEIEANKLAIINLLSNVKREGIESLVGWLDESDYFTAPASTMYHGQFEGGLAAHSRKVYQGFRQQVMSYKLSVPHESIILASLTHDVCKVGLYIPNCLKSGNISEAKPYKVEDSFPVGHGEKSVMMVQRHMQLTEQEAAIVRWHMGPYDPNWENYEEKIRERYPEVLLFHHVDQEVSWLHKL